MHSITNGFARKRSSMTRKAGYVVAMLVTLLLGALFYGGYFGGAVLLPVPATARVCAMLSAAPFVTERALR